MRNYLPKYSCAVFLFFICILSCSSSNDEKPGIKGSWYYDNIIINKTLIPYQNSGCGKNYVEFEDDGNMRSVNASDCNTTTIWEGTYILRKKKLSITNPSQEISAVITELSEHKLSYKYALDYGNDDVMDSITENYSR